MSELLIRPLPEAPENRAAGGADPSLTLRDLRSFGHRSESEGRKSHPAFFTGSLWSVALNPPYRYMRPRKLPLAKERTAEEGESEAAGKGTCSRSQSGKAHRVQQPSAGMGAWCSPGGSGAGRALPWLS